MFISFFFFFPQFPAINVESVSISPIFAKRFSTKIMQLITSWRLSYVWKNFLEIQDSCPDTS
jgi:hypothetical protein